MTEGREYAALAAVAAVSFALRFVPYALSGVPYHTDTWPQIENANVLLSRTPVPLSPASGFDNYNVYWPGLTLFTAVLSRLLGAGPYWLMPVAAPVVSSLSFVILAVFLRRLGMGLASSSLSSLISGVVLGSTLITAGATKEAYAFPLMFTFALLFTISLKEGRIGFISLSLLTFVSLLISHHLTSVVSILLAVYLLAFELVAVKRRLDWPAARCIAAVVAATVFSLYYFFIYASPVQLVVITPSFVISVVSYELAMLLPLSLGLGLSRGGAFAKYWTSGVLCLALFLPLYSVGFSVTANAPVIPAWLLLIAAPYLVILVLSVPSYLLSHAHGWHGGLGFSAFWGLGLLGILMFEAFGTPGDMGVALRIADFVFPAAVVAAVSLLSRLGSGGVRKLGLASLTVFVAASSLIGVLWVSYASGQLGGSQRVYFQSDVAAAGWVAAHASSGERIYGDARYSYLMSLHPSVNVLLGGGYRVVYTGSFSSPGCLILSSLISQVGYVGGEYGLPVNMTKIASLVASAPALPYTSGETRLVCSYSG